MARAAFSLAATVAGLLAVGADAQEPPRLNLIPNSQPVGTNSAVNQQLADAIAGQIRSKGLAAGANLSVVAIDGRVQLRGSAADAQQLSEIGRLVEGLPGVGSVDNQLTVSTGTPLAGAPIVAGNHGGGFVPGDPIPLNAPTYPAYDMNPPNMPPYSWPTYAPHNNFSRVAYPLAYPYNAWPYIGPFYPFPKVPLGWRKVDLEWEDGHWWYGRHSTPYDYWRVRFW